MIGRPRRPATKSEGPHANAGLSNNSRLMYKNLLLWLLGEATAGASFYAFVTYMPDFAKTIIVAAAIVFIWCDGRYLERARKLTRHRSFGSPSFLASFAASCGG